MLHIVHASAGRKFYVDATDSAQCIRILNSVGIDTVGAIADPYSHELRRGVKLYTIEDAMIPVLGGTYTLKLKDESNWVEVATCKFGPLWSEIYKNAAKTYGEDNVDYSFKLDRESVSEGNSYDL